MCKDAAVRWTGMTAVLFARNAGFRCTRSGQPSRQLTMADNTLTVISFLQAQGAEREMIRSMLEDMGIREYSQLASLLWGRCGVPVIAFRIRADSLADQDEWEDLKL